MSDVAIRLRGAAKAYRLYTSSWHRAFGIFNVRLGPLGAYKEHLALGNVDLEICAGNVSESLDVTDLARAPFSS